MKLLVLGKGKTGSLVTEIAAERGHAVTVLGAAENAGARALDRESLSGFDAVVDFTNPEAVMANISACARAGANMVVGTTGWYGELEYVRGLYEKNGAGFIYASNFSPGVNVFFEIAAAAAAAAKFGYGIKIVERHHVHKKDQPSGTAAHIQEAVRRVAGVEPEITSIREGEVVGTHVILLDGAHDTMMLVHDAKDRGGFAEGAVRAAEWIVGKKGFYEFSQVFEELP